MNVYADNAATTAVSDAAVAAMLPCFQEFYGNPSSLYTTGQLAAEKLAAAREVFARGLNAQPREITFTSGGSEADNQALRSGAAMGARKGKKHIISTKFEHHAILHTLESLQKEGFAVTLLPVNREGQVEPDTLARALTPETALVSVMTANNETGALQPIRELAALAHEQGALFHTDGVQALEKEGYEVTLLDIPPDGVVTAQQVRDAIRPDTCLVSIMFANNEIGTVQPIGEIGDVCREAGVLFHTDAVQAAGHLAIDVEALHIDMLSMSAHKFHGPKGVGVLYARRGIALENVIYDGAQERGKRAGTENVPGICGAAAAFAEACANLEKNAAYVTPMRDKLIAGLSAIPYSILNGDPVRRLPGNVNFCFEGIEGESLLLLLDAKGIAASSGSACTSGSLDPSHVLLALGRPHEVAHGSLRLSLSEYNKPEEVDYILEVLPGIIQYLRDMSPVWDELEKGQRPHLI